MSVTTALVFVELIVYVGQYFTREIMKRQREFLRREGSDVTGKNGIPSLKSQMTVGLLPGLGERKNTIDDDKTIELDLDSVNEDGANDTDDIDEAENLP